MAKEAKEKKSRKEKAPKDKNAPKKGKSAFLFYIAEKSASCKTDNPDLKHKEIISKLSKIWNDLKDDEKKHFNEQADKDKERYIKEKASYEAKKKAEGGSTVDTKAEKGKRKSRAEAPKAEKKAKKESAAKGKGKKSKKESDDEEDDDEGDEDEGDDGEDDEDPEDDEE